MEIRTVLFVDDEPLLLKALERTLGDEPYNLLLAESAEEAYALLKNTEIQVVVTDIMMRNIDGLQLINRLKKDYPSVIRIVMSGKLQSEVILKAINEGQIFKFIAKPWKSGEHLKEVIREAVDYYNLHGERESLFNVIEKIIENHEPEEINFDFLKKLIVNKKKNVDDWQNKCKATPLDLTECYIK